MAHLFDQHYLFTLSILFLYIVVYLLFEYLTSMCSSAFANAVFISPFSRGDITETLPN